MHSLKILRAAIEVKRRFSESPALEMADRCNYQRQRKNGCEWLDWACLFLRPVDDLTREQGECLSAFIEMPESWHWTEKRMMIAEDALCYLERVIHRDLWKEGAKIARML